MNDLQQKIEAIAKREGAWTRAVWHGARASLCVALVDGGRVYCFDEDLGLRAREPVCDAGDLQRQGEDVDILIQWIEEAKEAP